MILQSLFKIINNTINNYGSLERIVKLQLKRFEISLTHLTEANHLKLNNYDFQVQI